MTDSPPTPPSFTPPAPPPPPALLVPPNQLVRSKSAENVHSLSMNDEIAAAALRMSTRRVDQSGTSLCRGVSSCEPPKPTTPPPEHRNSLPRPSGQSSFEIGIDKEISDIERFDDSSTVVISTTGLTIDPMEKKGEHFHLKSLKSEALIKCDIN